MKKLKFILFIFIFLGCEKVIDLETDFNDTRLVVDANISKHRDSLNAKASVKLSETVPYFSDEESIINDAIVSIEINQKTHELYYDNPTKLYLADINFIENNSDFVLLIEHKKNNYTSSSKLIKTPKIESVVFGDRKSLNKDEVELKVTFTDPPEEGNYYLWKFGPKNQENLIIYLLLINILMEINLPFPFLLIRQNIFKIVITLILKLMVLQKTISIT